MKRVSIIALLLSTLFVSMACSQGETPAAEAPQPQVDETAVAVADTQPEAEADSQTETTPTLVPTFTPTAPPPTATATKSPPTATATLVVTATPTPVIHIVTQFDTLLQLAVDYDVSLEALTQANGIGEEDFLQLGQELVIPVDPGQTGAAGADEPAAEIETVSTEQEAASASAEETVAEAPAAPAPVVPVDSGPPPPDISHGANINPLTGLPVADPSVLKRRPLMVRIGNDTVARTAQVGLNQADVVYEEITEWWVTRFTAIYLANTPTTISPIRSARLINVQLVPQYQGALAHSGGSDGVRWEISQAPIANLDEFYNMAPYFYRENEGWQTRLALDGQAARNYMVTNGLEASVTQAGFPFSDAPEGGDPAPDIYIPYPQATSFTEWHYDNGSGKYLRWIDGAALVDSGDGQQVSAANVIVYFAEHLETDIVEDSNGMTAIRMLVNGTGPAWMFRDGLLTQGTWQSDGTRTPFFRQADGTPYSLKPGNTWIEVVPSWFTIGLNSADEASSR